MVNQEFIGARKKKLTIALLHKCDAECEIYKDKDSPIPGHWQIREWKFQRCPLVYVDESIFWFIRAHGFLQHGILPNEGGWLNQTNKFIQAMSYIDKIHGEIKEKERGKK